MKAPQPLPHILLDVRDLQTVEKTPLPEALKAAISLPGNDTNFPPRPFGMTLPLKELAILSDTHTHTGLHALE